MFIFCMMSCGTQMPHTSGKILKTNKCKMCNTESYNVYKTDGECLQWNQQ